MSKPTREELREWRKGASRPYGCGVGSQDALRLIDRVEELTELLRCARYCDLTDPELYERIDAALADEPKDRAERGDADLALAHCLVAGHISNGLVIDTDPPIYTCERCGLKYRQENP